MTVLGDMVLAYAAGVASDASECIQVRRRATAPRDTGELVASITASAPKRVGRNSFRVTVEQDSTAAPHGQIINNPSAPGGRIYPRRAKALGPFQYAGQTMLRASVRQSTEHAGWWDDGRGWNWEREWASCLGAAA